MKIGSSKTRSAPETLAPDSRLRLDAPDFDFSEFPRDFFRGSTVDIAQALIGTWLARFHDGKWHGARIVETEAYLGADDAAAHSWRGRRTKRNEPMYLDGGHLYVFLVYGMHNCSNVVTRTEAIAEAVLMRAAEGPEGCPSKLLSGPGRLCAALGITVADSGMDLLSGGNIRIFRNSVKHCTIGASKRIGVDYAGEAAKWPIRFFDLNSRAVSGPAKLNRGEALGVRQHRCRFKDEA
jgi:DNA-3-methyladenine glycosylase